MSQGDSSAALESPAARWIIAALSALAIAAVLLTVYRVPVRAAPGQAGLLPTINAVLNGAAGAFLVAGYAFIRRGRIRAHKACMLSAFGLSTAFFVSYLIHHSRVGSVSFQGEGWVRAVYFAFLVPHIVLAAAVVPLALLTIHRGWTARIVGHRRIARYTLPIWLFVSISGVVVYLMLY